MSVDADADRREGVVVAIDGPSGSGKSSVSREVAARLGIAYLDTGAMYRALAWLVLQRGLELGGGDAAEAEQAAVARLSRQMDLQISTDPQVSAVVVDGVEVTNAIRERRVSSVVSVVATNLEVRAELRRRQRAIIEAARPAGGIVAEGRDITTVVAPDADVRLLLTASEEARLARRALEVHGEAGDQARADVRDVVLGRDRIDSTVTVFQQAADGVTELDSSALDFEQTVEAVLGLVRRARRGDAPVSSAPVNNAIGSRSSV